MNISNITAIQTLLDELLLSFDKMKSVSGEEFDTLYFETKSKARKIYTFMHKLENSSGRSKDKIKRD